jgi:ribosomal protein S27E
MSDIHYSQFASELRCVHCGGVHRTSEWPVAGDRVAFYYQAEPGNYTLAVDCPHCGKQWFIVWDDDPGPIKTLFFA